MTAAGHSGRSVRGPPPVSVCPPRAIDVPGYPAPPVSPGGRPAARGTVVRIQLEPGPTADATDVGPVRFPANDK